MTKKQEKAIKVLEKYKNECIEEYKVEIEDKENIDEPHAYYLRQQIEAIETVLNMLNDLKNNTIPKSKVEEAITQLNDEYETFNTGSNDSYYILTEQYAFTEEKLRELLEDK